MGKRCTKSVTIKAISEQKKKRGGGERGVEICGTILHGGNEIIKDSKSSSGGKGERSLRRGWKKEGERGRIRCGVGQTTMCTPSPGGRKKKMGGGRISNSRLVQDVWGGRGGTSEKVNPCKTR